MAKTIRDWVENDVAPIRNSPLRWLSEQFFFRDPSRPLQSDPSYFFAPADGIIVYQKRVRPHDGIIDIKGKSYSLGDALRNEAYDKESLVIGIFMTFYDVHVNRIPYSGRLSWRELDPIATLNRPMLDVERGILEDLSLDLDRADYLHINQRVINTVYAHALRQEYYILQIADYDVDCITPFRLKQNQPAFQTERFSQIRYGSQVDLIVPISDRFELRPLLEPGMHVEGGVDPLIQIITPARRNTP